MNPDPVTTWMLYIGIPLIAILGIGYSLYEALHNRPRRQLAARCIATAVLCVVIISALTTWLCPQIAAALNFFLCIPVGMWQQTVYSQEKYKRADHRK